MRKYFKLVKITLKKGWSYVVSMIFIVHCIITGNWKDLIGMAIALISAAIIYSFAIIFVDLAVKDINNEIE